MKKNLIAAIVVLIIMAVGAFTLIGNTGSKVVQSTSGSATTTNVLFSTSQYAPYSYLVSTQNPTPQAQAALSGYTVGRTPEPDGSMNVTVSINGAAASQSLVVKPGYKLYIVETSFGDDGNGFDSSFVDDGFLLVDPNGYIA